MSNYKVTALLSSPLCGDAPYLDSILENEMAQRHGKAMKIDRGQPAPPVGSVHLPLLRGDFAGVRGIPRCSAPIVQPVESHHEHYAKRISVENADLLREDQRLVVATGNSWTKSYRLPNKITPCKSVVWFVGGSKRRNLISLLKTVPAIGKDRSQGYGRVSKWLVEETEHDWSWFADVPEGRLLMRVLPWSEEIEQTCIGFKRWFGGFANPYWHPDRQMEVALPC
jgi:hypothetical protein